MPSRIWPAVAIMWWAWTGPLTPAKQGKGSSSVVMYLSLAVVLKFGSRSRNSLQLSEEEYAIFKF